MASKLGVKRAWQWGYPVVAGRPVPCHSARPGPIPPRLSLLSSYPSRSSPAARPGDIRAPKTVGPDPSFQVFSDFLPPPPLLSHFQDSPGPEATWRSPFRHVPPGKTFQFPSFPIRKLAEKRRMLTKP
ncbi:hypothetical protein NL676_012690 [Syzygium grande]|nr:hypothetical protein NL676_012690 [Syzygium grande]